MHTKRILIVSIILLVYTSVIAHAQTLQTQDYTIKNPRIVTAGGFSFTDNYSLTNVVIGSICTGISGTNAYSIDITEAAQGAADTLPPSIDIELSTPPDGTIYLKGDQIDIACDAADDNIPLYYRFAIKDSADNIINDPMWSLDPTYAWNTTSSDIGFYSVTFEAKDIGRNKTSAASEIYLIHEPPPLPGVAE